MVVILATMTIILMIASTVLTVAPILAAIFYSRGRVPRKTFVVASTVLAVAFIPALVRSFYSRDRVVVGWPFVVTIESGGGRLLVRSSTMGSLGPPRYVRFEHRRVERTHNEWWAPPRIYFTFRGPQFQLHLPYLYLIALTAIPPAVWLRRIPHRRRLKRLSQGHCPNCGYDLRRTPGRCSECGTLVTSFPSVTTSGNTVQSPTRPDKAAAR
jgi:hypothetical protein